jgi:hypothetical protein
MHYEVFGLGLKTGLGIAGLDTIGFGIEGVVIDGVSVVDSPAEATTGGGIVFSMGAGSDFSGYFLRIGLMR